MLLSELHTGEKAIIAKVSGHGAFRKRIIEMGFIKGTEVVSILNAPLNDPIKYRIMNFEVSLRREDAEKVEVVTKQEAEQWKEEQENVKALECDTEEKVKELVNLKSKTINVALVGNPNCGKTSIFNVAAHAHERVGNYSGVTVDEKVGSFEFNGYKFNLIDLPGTYSLSAYSPEELYVRKHIMEKAPDIILNVIDSSNIERNLYLTMQTIDMDIRMVMALNMFDELKQSGDKLDYQTLGSLLGVPIVPTVGRTGEGINQLFQKIIDVYEGTDSTSHHIHINHGIELESQIKILRDKIYEYGFAGKMSTRFLAIKLMENDSQMEKFVLSSPNGKEIIELRDEIKQSWQKKSNSDLEASITDAKYGFIRGALKEVYVKNDEQKQNHLTDAIDAIVTNKYLGYPVFLLFMFITFFATFFIGKYPMDWIDSLFGWLGDSVGSLMNDGPLKSLIVDGAIGGVGSVIVFLPNILILYLFISFMEDSGYMSRAAFIMDRIMHKMGLHGKSFIPMIMGFGCNIPAIMATRTIEDRKSRLITMFIIPLMSCSARIPVYLILVGAFFSKYAAIILLGLYMLGMIMSIIMAKLFSRFVIKGESTPFVMELPPYRMPTFKNVFRHTWEKGKQYLKKMGTIILGASVIVWALGYFPNHDTYSNPQQQLENSYMGMIGKTIEPVLAPCGMDWKQSVSVLTGLAAKEVVASTMGVLYSANETEAEQVDIDSDDGALRISKSIRNNMTPLSAMSMLIFVLLYMPCLASIIAIKGESGKWKWALFVVVYTIALAWVSSTLVFQLGSLII
ncbi:MAG: ferrous iron transport protein B [Bacteroidales bacterium]|nr:ferrous iron transport protein B [Candidatus Scybalousia scybalohippi]